MLQILEQFVAVADKVNKVSGLVARLSPSLPCLVSFAEILKRWNSRMNLIAPASDEQLLSRHILDCAIASVIIRQELEVDSERSYMDIGSGAGLPGVVLAILEPEREVILVEPREKRCIFLLEVKRVLGLSKVKVVRSRLEDLSSNCLANAGLLVSRAISRDINLVEAANNTHTCYQRCAAVVEMLGPSFKLENTPEYLQIRQFQYELPPDRAKRVLTISEMIPSQ